MARYNREFLVPYLQNICALHLAHSKLSRQYSDLSSTASRLRDGVSNPKPKEPKYDHVGCWTVFCLGFGLFMSIGLIGFFISGENDVSIYAAFFAIVAFFLGFGVYGLYEVKRNNSITRREYEAACKRYEQLKHQNENSLNRVEAYDTRMARCARERDRVGVLLQNVYSANVIPARYRNIYAAVYLYDWFSTSGADDLDHALSMFVLEEIKERLDIIIENQSDMILNQRIIIANQQKSIEQQRNYESMMRSKLNRMQATQEEQLCYTRMIESNTAVSAYFASADYIRRT